MGAPYNYPTQSDFLSFIKYFEHEASHENDVSVLVGYGIVNGLLKQPSYKSIRGLTVTDILSVYSGLKDVSKSILDIGIVETVNIEKKKLPPRLSELEQSAFHVKGLAHQFLNGNHNNLYCKKNIVEYLRTFGSKTANEAKWIGRLPSQTQHRVSDYNIIETVLREIR